MAERSEVLRVQNDALLSEYHQLILAQVRRIDEALAIVDRERRNLEVEREHLVKHLPPPPDEQKSFPLNKEPNSTQGPAPKLVQKGPAIP
jgi:hypothetical protein